MSRGEKKVAEQFGLVDAHSSHSPNKGQYEELADETTVNYHASPTPQYFIFSESAAQI